MSFQVGSACYDTPEAAAAASASSQVGSVVPHGPSSYVVNASTVEAASITYTLTPIGGGAPLSVASPYTAQPCGLMTAADGLQIGWLMAACWIATWGIKFMATSLKGWGDQHGNT